MLHKYKIIFQWIHRIVSARTMKSEVFISTLPPWHGILVLQRIPKIGPLSWQMRTPILSNLSIPQWTMVKILRTWAPMEALDWDAVMPWIPGIVDVFEPTTLIVSKTNFVSLYLLLETESSKIFISYFLITKCHILNVLCKEKLGVDIWLGLKKLSNFKQLQHSAAIRLQSKHSCDSTDILFETINIMVA